MRKQVTHNDLAKYFSNNCKEQEKKEIESWYKQSDENARLYEQLKSVWKNSKVEIPSFDTEEALTIVSEKLDRTPYEDSNYVQLSKRNKPLRTIVSIAATIAVLIGLYFIYSTLSNKGSENMISLTTKKGEIVEVTLADGSNVWINTLSQLNYPESFSDDKRVVYLQGEAYFKVASNPGKPFVIETANSTTQVYGTAFNLQAIDGDEQEIITVTEGLVGYTPKDYSELEEKISKGEQCTLDIVTRRITKSKTFDPNFDSWRTKSLVFHDTHMDKVVQAINKYFDTTIRIADESLKEMGFTSTFSEPELDEVLKVIELTGEIEILRNDGEITLKKKQ